MCAEAVQNSQIKCCKNAVKTKALILLYGSVLVVFTCSVLVETHEGDGVGKQEKQQQLVTPITDTSIPELTVKVC